MLYECPKCGSLIEEASLVHIRVCGRTGRYDDRWVCPDCLDELLENLPEELAPAEEREIRDEWDADARYDERKLMEG